MNYKVLYRKYRPTNFEEVVGQRNSIELLKDGVERKKISHAYIFSGPRGTGKTSTAKIFAKAINCLCDDGVKPCNKCEKCLNFAQSSDIYEIDAASNNGVDQIREIIDNIKLSPISSNYKVYIIDEVHMLSTSAFNALLLTLEEPPSHVVFILATTDIEDVPITVLSRCQRLDFKKISNKDIKETLSLIAKKEKIIIDEAAINEIAEFADGGLRDALSILDQLSKTTEKITQDIVLESIGLISTKSILELIESIEKNNIDDIITFVERVREIRSDYKTLLKKIIHILKNKAAGVKKGTERSRLEYSEYKDLCLELAVSLYKSNVNIDSYAILELILLNYVTSEVNTLEKSDISQEINLPETDKTKKNVIEKYQITEKEYFPRNNTELIDIRINNCFVKANKKFLQLAKDAWNQFIASTKNKKLKGLLLDTDVVLSSDDIVVIKTEFKETSEVINSNLEELEQEFSDLLEKKYKFIALDESRWNIEMENYKNNIKNNIVYNYLEEPKIGQSELDDIFTAQKIEIK